MGLSYGLKVRIRVEDPLLWLRSKIVIVIWFKMMFQIFPNHLFGHLSNCRAKITSRPEMPSPIPFLDEWKLFKQLSRRPSFDPPHDLTRRHRRWRRYQDVDMLLAHYPFQNPDLERLACLTNQIPHTQCYITLQNLISVLRYPHKVIFNGVRRMAAVPIFPKAQLNLYAPSG